MALDSCSTLLQPLYCPPLLISVQYCGYVPHNQPRALETELASICVGSSERVLHCRLANIDTQGLALGAGAGPTTGEAEVEALGALVVDELVVDELVVDEVVGLVVDELVVDLDVDELVVDLVVDEVGVGWPMLALMALEGAHPPPRVLAIVPKSDAVVSRLYEY